MFYIIIESTHLQQILKYKLIEYTVQPMIIMRKTINLDIMNTKFISNISLSNAFFHYVMQPNEYLFQQPLVMKKLNYLEIYEVLTNINFNTLLLWSKLFLLMYVLRLSFVFNAKYFSMYTDVLENYPQLYLNVTSTFKSQYSANLISLNLRVLFLKITNLLKIIKCFYKKPGSPYLRVRRIFPAVNIAFRFKISKYVLLLMNLVALLMPLMFVS